MTVSVSNDDDDEEDKRFAFSLSFVMKRCARHQDAACEFMDPAFTPFILPARAFRSPGGPVPGTPGPREIFSRVKKELICR
jgi:hypothetical protein